jgi:large subunit ribosomal protein L5
MESVKQKDKKVFDALKEAHGYKNAAEAPHLDKIVLSVGTGKKMKNDRKINDFISDRLAKITGQKPSVRKAKQSNAGFKLREGEEIGLAVTLRGDQMYSFIDKFIHIATPRTKDFRGYKRTGIDEMGNLTIGIKEHTIFPETGNEELRDVFSFAITFVTTATNKTEAEDYFDFIGLPFKKKD